MQDETMRVQVRPINVNGVAQATQERIKGAPVHGDLRITDTREDSFGRVLLTAQVVDVLNTPEVVQLVLHDVVLLSIMGKKMRMRGFEMQGPVQYAQAWEIEVE
jgi:hypothetical protein